MHQNFYFQMPYLDDITYDIIYDAASALSRILYQPNQQHPYITIQLTTSEPFTFIRLFDNIVECQDYIRQNVHKQITLFISSANVIGMRALFACNQLRDIYVFCMLPRHKPFFSRYLQDVQHKVRNIFMYDKLECELLLHGVNHCRKVADQNERENHAITTLALRDGERLATVLSNYFATQMAQHSDQQSHESTA